jgi:hypothetical protein
MWQRTVIFKHVHLRLSMNADLLNISKREEEEEEEEGTKLYDYNNHDRKRHNQTFPDPVPMPTHLPDTAEHTGRYSVGSHNRF